MLVLGLLPLILLHYLDQMNSVSTSNVWRRHCIDFIKIWWKMCSFNASTRVVTLLILLHYLDQMNTWVLSKFWQETCIDFIKIWSKMCSFKPSTRVVTPHFASSSWSNEYVCDQNIWQEILYRFHQDDEAKCVVLMLVLSLSPLILLHIVSSNLDISPCQMFDRRYTIDFIKTMMQNV